MTHRQMYFKSERWRLLKQECLRRSEGRCEYCGHHAHTAHHLKYPSDMAADSIDNVKAVCWACHKGLHPYRESLATGILRASDYSPSPLGGPLQMWQVFRASAAGEHSERRP